LAATPGELRPPGCGATAIRFPAVVAPQARNVTRHGETRGRVHLSLRYYFEPAGLISAGVFLKELKDFIFTQGGPIVGGGADNGFGGL
jgi:hypothetical protein